MSVLIKGKALPKCCGDCWLARCVAYSDYCRVLSVDINVIDPTYKHPNCPLVEVSEPHGRLIDASYKVDMPFYDDEYEEFSMRTVTVEELLLMADNEVPTVIEAEGSDDDERTDK